MLKGRKKRKSKVNQLAKMLADYRFSFIVKKMEEFYDSLIGLQVFSCRGGDASKAIRSIIKQYFINITQYTNQLTFCSMNGVHFGHSRNLYKL